MMLRKRRKRKAAQALDALAGATKIWSELQIGKKAGQGVAKVKKVRLPWLKSKRAKAAGAVVVAGGVGAVVAKKLKGGDPATSYSGPEPSKATEAAASAPDAPPPLAIAPEPATTSGPPAVGAAGLRDDGDAGSDAPAAPAAPEAPVAAQPPAAAEPDEPVATEVPPVEDEPTAEAGPPDDAGDGDLDAPAAT